MPSHYGLRLFCTHCNKATSFHITREKLLEHQDHNQLIEKACNHCQNPIHRFFIKPDLTRLKVCERVLKKLESEDAEQMDNLPSVKKLDLPYIHYPYRKDFTNLFLKSYRDQVQQYLLVKTERTISEYEAIESIISETSKELDAYYNKEEKVNARFVKFYNALSEKSRNLYSEEIYDFLDFRVKFLKKQISKGKVRKPLKTQREIDALELQRDHITEEKVIQEILSIQISKFKALSVSFPVIQDILQEVVFQNEVTQEQPDKYFKFTNELKKRMEKIKEIILSELKQKITPLERMLKENKLKLAPLDVKLLNYEEAEKKCKAFLSGLTQGYKHIDPSQDERHKFLSQRIRTHQKELANTLSVSRIQVLEAIIEEHTKEKELIEKKIYNQFFSPQKEEFKTLRKEYPFLTPF